MKTSIVLFLSLILSLNCFSQVAMAPPEIPTNDFLSSDAYRVFSANKFLNFKGADTLKETINGKLYKAYNLKTSYFSWPKDWAKIEQEDSTYYRQHAANYKYEYTDSTMTETYSESNHYGAHKDFKTIYNPRDL